MSRQQMTRLAFHARFGAPGPPFFLFRALFSIGCVDEGFRQEGRILTARLRALGGVREHFQPVLAQDRLSFRLLFACDQG